MLPGGQVQSSTLNRIHEASAKFQRYKILLRRRWWFLLLTASIGMCVQALTITGKPQIFRSLAKLVAGGRMVANVVTLEVEMHLYDLQEKHGGDLVRMDVSTLTRVGNMRAMRPRMAVTQWRVTKA